MLPLPALMVTLGVPLHPEAAQSENEAVQLLPERPP